MGEQKSIQDAIKRLSEIKGGAEEQKYLVEGEYVVIHKKEGFIKLVDAVIAILESVRGTE